MLKIDKLKKQYKNFTLNCSMEVKEGMITGFVGPNGSGKSTTLKAVLGLIYRSVLYFLILVLADILQ